MVAFSLMTAKDIISRAMLKRLTTDPARRLLEIDGIASTTDDGSGDF